MSRLVKKGGRERERKAQMKGYQREGEAVNK